MKCRTIWTATTSLRRDSQGLQASKSTSTLLTRNTRPASRSCSLDIFSCKSQAICSSTRLDCLPCTCLVSGSTRAMTVKSANIYKAVMIIWGVISACTAATRNFGDLIAVRFFLGFIEAAYVNRRVESYLRHSLLTPFAFRYFPGCLFFLSSWYTRKELALRSAVLYSGSLISGAFSGLIAAGITSGLDGARGLSAWRW